MGGLCPAAELIKAGMMTVTGHVSCKKHVSVDDDDYPALNFLCLSSSNPVRARALLHRASEATAAVRTVPVGPCCPPTQGQSGQLTAACHRVH